MPFSDFQRTDELHKRRSESSFQYLDRSARPEIARVREYFCNAIQNYPLSERPELIARFQSGNESAFRSAAFEVLLFTGLSSIGFQLEPHPDPGTGSEKRPDFLVTAPDGEQFFLEAVLAGERDGTDPGSQALIRTTIDRLDEAVHPNFLIDVDSSGAPQTQPSSKLLIKVVHEWLDSLQVDQLHEVLQSFGLESMPILEWSHEAWNLTLRAIPLRPQRRGNAKRLIGASGDGARCINAWEPLRAAVKSKANRYGELEKPLVVAINADAFNLDPIDERQSLYGEECWIEVIGRPELGHADRQPNGAWRGPKGPQNRRASAVWFFNDLTPYTLATRRGTLYFNSWAHVPGPSSMHIFPHQKLEGDKLVSVPGMSLSRMFGVLPEWPE
jgi:hypothetical protein